MTQAQLKPAAPVHRMRPATIVTADGLQLAYEDWGAGPTVVLAHSWALQSAMWRQQIPALVDAGFRVVAYDRRGHGRSEGNGQGYDIDALADDMAAMFEQLNLGDVTLVAHSMGSCEAVRYLTRHGHDRVARLVLLAPTLPFMTKTADNPLGIDEALFEQGWALWRQDFAKWVADNTEPFFTPRTPSETKAWMARMTEACPVPVALAVSRAFVGVDFRPDLAAIRLPTLILHGDADASTPLEITGVPTAAAIEGSRLVVLPGAPHGLFVTHDEEINRAIVDFARA
jgi:non-heme chloroperoxidase